MSQCEINEECYSCDTSRHTGDSTLGPTGNCDTVHPKVSRTTNRNHDLLLQSLRGRTGYLVPFHLRVAPRIPIPQSPRALRFSLLESRTNEIKIRAKEKRKLCHAWPGRHWRVLGGLPFDCLILSCGRHTAFFFTCHPLIEISSVISRVA